MSAAGFSEGFSPALPATLTPLLGRDAELDETFALIDDPGIRLVTITGPGGVGKTRLALHLAKTLIDEFERDVVFVPLADVPAPSLVATAIAHALGIEPSGGESVEESLVRELGERRMLLVLDNFEHLLNAATSLVEMLDRCPDVTALVTSRAALNVPGEHRYLLAPLPVPEHDARDREALIAAESSRLFIARARPVRPDLEIDDRTAATIAEICRRLDGLPLAIELAAARISILSPDALLARLEKRLQVLGGEQRGVADRLRTMRHAIAWSYDLLTQPQQALFRQLCIYAGGFGPNALDLVARSIDGISDPLDALAALIDHSLVLNISPAVGEARYTMLETLREFGLEQLDHAGEFDSARQSHAAFIVELAESAEPGLTGADQLRWFDKLDAEWANIRATCTRAEGHLDPEPALRIFGAIWRFCLSRGRATEARALLSPALESTAGQETVVRARALAAMGSLAEEQRDLEVAEHAFDEARAIGSRLGAVTVEIAALIGSAYVARYRGHLDSASEMLDRAIELAEQSNDQRQRTSALASKGAVSYYQGDMEAAEGLWEAARLIVATLNDVAGESVLLSNLGAVASARGDYAVAVSRQERALEIARQVNDRPATAQALGNLSENLIHLRDYDRAEACLAESLAIVRDLGMRGTEAVGLFIDAQIALARGELERCRSSLHNCLDHFTSIGDELALAESADLTARLLVAQEQYLPAIELQSAAAALRARLDATIRPVEAQERDQATNRIRRAVSESEWRRHWRIGSEFDIDTLGARMREATSTFAGRSPITPSSPVERLTRREREILTLLTEGLSPSEVAERLFISPRTATTHVTNIFDKLEVHSRSAAVAVALRAGLGAEP